MHGLAIPKKIVTDNGPSFTSSTFKAFMDTAHDTTEPELVISTRRSNRVRQPPISAI